MAATPTTYVVKQGDSLIRIAAALGIKDWRAFYELNKGVIGSNPSLIKPGQVLALPVAGGGTTPATPAKPAAPVIDADKASTGVVKVGGTTLSQGGRLVRVRNPAGVDAKELYYVVYNWRGVNMAFEVGDRARLNKLFGSIDVFDDVATYTQAGFDNAEFVEAGMIDQELGATESFTSRTEREVRALGLEDLPSWLANAPDALSIVAEAAAQEWSQGRLWKELQPTKAFQARFGTALPKYLQQGVTVGDAVAQIVADENELRDALRPFLVGTQGVTTNALQGMLNKGWTAGAAAQVLESAETLRRDPDSLAVSNFILEQSGLKPLNEVSYINALNGHAPQETIEALNTATAGRALSESGIDLEQDDYRLIMELVDTSDRLLTVDSWRQLSQQLSFDLIRNSHELDTKKLGLVEEDLVAAAFGRSSPTGKSSGQVLSLVARMERDRRAAAQGFDGSTGYLDDRGRLRIQGLGGL